MSPYGAILKALLKQTVLFICLFAGVETKYVIQACSASAFPDNLHRRLK